MPYVLRSLWGSKGNEVWKIIGNHSGVAENSLLLKPDHVLMANYISSIWGTFFLIFKGRNVLLRHFDSWWWGEHVASKRRDSHKHHHWRSVISKKNRILKIEGAGEGGCVQNIDETERKCQGDVQIHIPVTRSTITNITGKYKWMNFGWGDEKYIRI